VTIASLAGIFGSPGLTDYNASKFGAVGFDEALRLELKVYHIIDNLENQKLGQNYMHLSFLYQHRDV